MDEGLGFGVYDLEFGIQVLECGVGGFGLKGLGLKFKKDSGFRVSGFSGPDLGGTLQPSLIVSLFMRGGGPESTYRLRAFKKAYTNHTRAHKLF